MKIVSANSLHLEDHYCFTYTSLLYYVHHRPFFTCIIAFFYVHHRLFFTYIIALFLHTSSPFFTYIIAFLLRTSSPFFYVHHHLCFTFALAPLIHLYFIFLIQLADPQKYRTRLSQDYVETTKEPTSLPLMEAAVRSRPKCPKP